MSVSLREIAAAVVLAATVAVSAERVPDAGVVNGIPQGIFFSRSLLTGRAVCLLFLSEGRVTRFIPSGGLENFDWAKHRAAHGPDSGTWTLTNGQLRIQWGDGGVNQGPITLHPDGIEFYGKRYAKPVPVTLAAIAGRWEAARGTAIAGGSGVNRATTLVIQPDGHYQWVSTTGGVVSGRAAAGEASMKGTLTISGATMTMKSDAGAVTSTTFLPAAGAPVQAFTLDADLFTRTGPSPVSGPAVSDPDAPARAAANNYQGLVFNLPPGWTTGMQQGRFVMNPPKVSSSDGGVIVVLYGREQLNGLLGDWLRTKMASDLGSGAKVVQSAPPTAARSGALEVLSAGRTIQDQRGSVFLQIYYGVSDGRQAGLAMVMTASEAALTRRMTDVQALFQSLRFSAVPAAGATRGSTTAGAVDLLGSWSHASSTTAFGQGYVFAADGTYTYAFTGMMDRVHISERDSGTWELQGANLVLRSRERNRVKTYQIVQYQTGADGSTVMTWLLDSYPRTDSNINVWGERYVRGSK